MDHLDPSRHPEPSRSGPNSQVPSFSSLPSPPEPAQQRLIGDLQQVIDNAEDLLNCTDGARDGAYRSAREQLAHALAVANQELQRFEDAQLGRMIAATHAASLQHNDSTGEARLLRAFR